MAHIERAHQKKPELLELKAASINIPRNPEHNAPSQDAVLVDYETSTFGVFDGMGGHLAGDVASSKAAEAIQEMAADDPDVHLKDMLSLTNDKLIQLQNESPHEYSGMGTTATVVRFDRDESIGDFFEFAHVGDTRLVVLRDGKVRPVTTDECSGSQLYNVVGRPDMTVLQTGRIPLRNGDRVVLMSDGITGDSTEEILSENEYKAALDNKFSAEEAAQNLIDISKKYDDKAIVAIDYVGSPTEGISQTGDLEFLNVIESLQQPVDVIHYSLDIAASYALVANLTGKNEADAEGIQASEIGDDDQEFYDALTQKTEVYIERVLESVKEFDTDGAEVYARRIALVELVRQGVDINSDTYEEAMQLHGFVSPRDPQIDLQVIRNYVVTGEGSKDSAGQELGRGAKRKSAE